MRLSQTQQKILLVLMGGAALSMSTSPTTSFRALRAMRKEWQSINQQSFNRSFRNLSKYQLVQERVNADGVVVFSLTEKGKRKAKFLHLFEQIAVFKRPKRWDKKWRIVFFDIPEKRRFFRGILRGYLRTIGFKKIQQSVFVFPFPCEVELKKLIAIYKAEPYITIATAEAIDKEKYLKKRFSLTS